MASLILCYALQVLSPLRLNTDAVALLSIGKSVAEGHGFLQNGQPTVFPPGYPALLAILLRTGLGHSWAIIGLNVIMLAAGLFAAYQVFLEDLFCDKVLGLNLCSLSMLSFVIIKHFTIAVTDIAFLCVALCAVAAMSHAAVATWGRRFVVTVTASWLLVMGAIAVRRIGVALVPAFIFMVVSRPEVKTLIRDLSARTKAILAVVVAGSVIGIIWAIASTSTLSDLTTAMNNSSVFHTILKIVYSRLIELGQLMLNVPISRLPTIVYGIVPFIGLVPLLLMLEGLLSISRKRKIRPIDVFLVSYLIVLFAWPYTDTRFWIPVIPLLVGYSAVALGRAVESRPPRLGIACYISIFVILGIASIGYTTRITFAGSKFPDLYGDGALRPTYCEAFQSCSDTYDKSKVNPKALDLIQTYR